MASYASAVCCRRIDSLQMENSRLRDKVEKERYGPCRGPTLPTWSFDSREYISLNVANGITDYASFHGCLC